MIIKRKLKSQMPSMKRCRLGHSAADDDESPVVKKKRKMNGYFPLNLLGDVAAGIIPLSGYGLHQIFGGHGGVVAASWCTEISSCAAGEMVSISKDADGAGAVNRTDQVHRPPLVRTSRGRVQVLPSRFNDSILDNWRKESKPNAREITLDEDFKPEKEKPCWKTPKQSVKKGSNEGKFGQQCRKFSALCPEDGNEMVYMGLKNVGTKKKYSSSRSSLTSLHEQLAEVERYPTEEVEEKFNLGRFNKESKGGSRLEQFISGDIVWAKSGKKDPFWPAIVIDPTSQAPAQVLSSCIAGAVCVMFFGYSGNGTRRDYGWIKEGMIFPFIDNVERFQGQSDLNDSRPSDFRTAIEEAFLTENGFIEKLTEDINVVAGKPNYLESTREVQEATGSNQDQECDSQDQDVFWKKDTWPCDQCGLRIPLRSTKKMKVLTPKGRFLCRTCDRLKSKHYCGICKRMQNQSDSGTWVRCDGCKVWVHAECAKISSKLFKTLGATDYYCPSCKAKFNFELSDSEKWQPRVKCNKNSSQLVLPNKVTVICSGVEGIYFPRIHLVVCKCGSCGSEKQSLSEWERHTGSKGKNWKTSVRVKGSMMSLEQWMLQVAEDHDNSFVPVNPPKRPSIRERRQKLLTFLQEKYEPVPARWTTERCAVCRWVEDWDYNKIIICNRCQIAVHQECYGARNVRDFTSWVCRACETPDIEQECCLCPVKEDRREYLESLLRESKKEEAMPVLDDDALNDLLARSEPEIDIFESVDKKRREVEMAAWKKVVGQGTEPTPPLPSRLVTDEDLKVFYEAMKIYEVSNDGVLSNTGVKRKGENLGGLDTQQYGRGKRAREVRSYEEQWTEEEFEKLCQVDSPESPKLKEEAVETNLPMDSSGPVVVTNNTESPAPLPPPPPSASSVDPAPQQSKEAVTPPSRPAPQQGKEVTPPSRQAPQQSKEVTPPSRRGRGRPKRATLDISSAVVSPAPSGTEKPDMGSQKGNVSSFPTASNPYSFPGPNAVNAVKGASLSMQNVGEGFSDIPLQSLPPVLPGSQSTVPHLSVPSQVKGQGRKAQSGEGSRRRGKKQASVLPTAPDALVGQDPKLNEQSQKLVGKKQASVPPSVPDALAGGQDPKLNEQSQNRLGDLKLNEPSQNKSGTELTEQSHNNSVDSLGSEKATASCFPTAPGHDSVPASTTVKSISGSMQHFGVGTAPSSQAAPHFNIVAPDSKSSPPCPSVVTQVKGQGRKTQSGAETSRRRGRKQALVPPAVPGGLVGEEATNQGSQNKSGDLVGADSGTVSSLPVASDPTTVPAIKVISGTMHHFGVGIAPSSQSVPLSPSLAPSSQSTVPCPTVSVRVKGQSQKAQGGVGASRRRGKKQSSVPPCIPDSLAVQDPKSSEKLQRKSGNLSGSGAISMGSEREKDSWEPTNAMHEKECKIHTSDVLAVMDLKSTEQPDYSVQNKKPRTSSATDSIAGQNPKSNEEQDKSWDSLQDQAIVLRSEQEETQELTNAIQEKASNDSDLKLTEQLEFSAQNETPRISPASDGVVGEDPISNEKVQDKSGESLGNQAIAMRAEQEDAKAVTNAIVEQAGKVHSSDVLTGTDPKSTEQSENLVQYMQPRSSSTAESSKDPELYDSKQDTSGDLLRSQATVSRSEQEKELTIVIQEQACNIHASGVLVDNDLKSSEVSNCSAQNQMQATSLTTHDSAGQDTKSNVKLPDKSGYSLETKVISVTTKEVINSHEVESTVQEQECKIHGFDVLAGQHLKSTEQLDYSPKNLKEASSSTTNDSSSTLPEHGSVALQVIEGDASLKSEEETLPIEVQASDASDVASLAEKVSSKMCSTEAKIDVCFASGAWDGPSVSNKTLFEVTKNESLEGETCSTLPTFVAATSVINSAVGNDENPSGKKGIAEIEENEGAILDEALVSNPEVSESHSKVTAGSTGNMTNSEQLIDVHSSMMSNMAVIGTIPPTLQTLETCSSEVEVEEFVCDGGVAPNFPESRLTSTEVTKNQISDDDKNSTKLISEKGTSDLDVPVSRLENQSGKDGDADEQKDRDPPPVVALVSKLEPEMSADSVENITFSGHLIKENLEMGSNTDVTCKGSSSVNSSETCSSNTKVGKPFGNDGDAPVVLLSSKTVIEVNKNENLEDNSCSTISISETEAPVLDLPISNQENQCDDGDPPTVPVSSKTDIGGIKNQNLENKTCSTVSSLGKGAPVLDLQICGYEKQCVKEGDAKEEEDKEAPLMEQTIVSGAKSCELESMTIAGSAETITISEQIVVEKTSMDEVHTVSFSVRPSDIGPSDTKISESFGAEGGDALSLPVSCDTSTEVIKKQSLELKICSEITSEAGSPSFNLRDERRENQSDMACIAEMERGSNPVEVDALVLESEASEPEADMTSSSVGIVTESSLPIEGNSILGRNVETICSDALISSQVDGISCPKSPACDDALVDLSVKASSMQMDSPFLSEDAAEFNDMAKNISDNRSKPLLDESTKSSPLAIKDFDAPTSSVKTDDVGSPPVDSVGGLPVDPDDSGICNLDGGVHDEDKLSMVSTEGNQCSSKFMSGVAVTSLEAEIVTSHNKASPKSSSDESEDKGKPTLEHLNSTIYVGNAEVVSKDGGRARPMAGVECSESEHDGAHSSKEDLSEAQASSSKVLFNSNDGVSSDFDAEIADPMDVTEGGVTAEQAPVLEPMHPVAAKSGNTEGVLDEIVIKPVMVVESSKADTDEVCQMDVNMDVAAVGVKTENIDSLPSSLERQIEKIKSSSVNNPVRSSSSLEMLVENSSLKVTLEENMGDSPKKVMNASSSSLETQEEKIEGSFEKDLAARSPSLEAEESKIEVSSKNDPVEKDLVVPERTAD